VNANGKFELYFDDLVDPVLIASFDDLGAAKLAMNTVAVQIPGQYFVWLANEEEIVARVQTDPEYGSH
jgi:hypothetical protein